MATSAKGAALVDSPMGPQLEEGLPATDEDFASVAARRICELMDSLGLSAWNVRAWRRRPWDAEHRKLVGRLLASLSEALRLEEDGFQIPSATRIKLAALIASRDALRSTDATLEVVDEVRKALVPIADDRYLAGLLLDERSRDQRRQMRRSEGTSRASTLVSWREFYPELNLDDLLRHSERAFPRQRVRLLLLSLFESRRERYRLHRARTPMNRSYSRPFLRCWTGCSR